MSKTPKGSHKSEKKTMSEASLANLRPFKSGAEWNGNAGGRPRKTLLSEVTQEMLEEKFSDPVERQKWKEAQWSKMLKHGVVGAMFMDAAWDRTEGKVAQPVRVSGELSVSLADEIRKARERGDS